MKQIEYLFIYIFKFIILNLFGSFYSPAEILCVRGLVRLWWIIPKTSPETPETSVLKKQKHPRLFGSIWSRVLIIEQTVQKRLNDQKRSARGLRIRLKTIWQPCSLATYCNLQRVETWAWGNLNLILFKIYMRRTFILPLIGKDSFSLHITLYFYWLQKKSVAKWYILLLLKIMFPIDYLTQQDPCCCWFHHSKAP